MLRFGNVGVLEKDEADHDCPTITSLSGKKKAPLSAKSGGAICKGFGGGIYLPEYFDLIETMRPHATEEVDDVPVHQILAEEGKLVGVPLEGTAFDAGHSLGFRAAVHFAGRPGS